MAMTLVADLVPRLKQRELPIIHEKADMESVIRAMIRFEHSRLLYVTDDDGKLTGAISLGVLIRHVFSESYEPQVYSGFILKRITAEYAKDVMQKNPVVAAYEEGVDTVLKKMIRTNTKEVPVLDAKQKVIADLKMIDLFGILFN